MLVYGNVLIKDLWNLGGFGSTNCFAGKGIVR
jgi:hypothetical protein